MPPALKSQVATLIAWCEANAADAEDLHRTLDLVQQALHARATRAQIAADVQLQTLRAASLAQAGKVALAVDDTIA